MEQGLNILGNVWFSEIYQNQFINSNYWKEPQRMILFHEERLTFLFHASFWPICLWVLYYNVFLNSHSDSKFYSFTRHNWYFMKNPCKRAKKSKLHYIMADLSLLSLLMIFINYALCWMVSQILLLGRIFFCMTFLYIFVKRLWNWWWWCNGK